MKKELLSVSLMCCLLAFQHATPAKAQAAGKAGGNRQQTEQQRQNHSISGHVADTDGEPLIGVTVKLVGTKRTVLTDVNGNFTFVGCHPGDQLDISYIGKKTVRRKVGTKRLSIVLEDDANSINDVIITGYGNIDKRKSTVAATTVKMEDVLMPGMTTVDQALEGRIPDLEFNLNSGEVGATARLRVRGTSTLVGNREPLWVLDGFVLSDPVDVSADQLNDPDYINYIGNAIQGINPQDIERIDVLKDAAATALYGTRASNGVIVVTTKRGKAGPPTIRYSNQTKLTRRPRYTDSNIRLMNSQQRVQFGKDLCDMHYKFSESMPLVGYEGAFYRYQTAQTSYDEFLDEVQGYETMNTDWFKLLTRDAVTMSHTVNVSGGSENTRYYASVGYTRENGTVKTQYVDRYTANMNITSDLTKNLKARIALNGNIQKKNHLPSNVDPLTYAYETTRALPAYNADGSLYYYKNHGYSVGNGQKVNNLYNYNILNEMENSSSEYNGIMAMGDLTWRLKDILTLSASASYQRSSTLQATWYGENTNYVAILKNGEAADKPISGESGYCELPYGGVYNTSNTYGESFTSRFQANYNQYLDSERKHNLQVTLGYEVNTSRTKSNAQNTRGFYKDRGMKYATMTGDDLDLYPYYKKWLASNKMSIGNGKSNSLSGYADMRYDYDSYFTLGASARFDASNQFGSRSNEKFLPVWSVSGRWNVMKTFFGENSRLINQWNIKASYGKTGNIPNSSPNLQLAQGTMDSFYGEYVSTISGLPNPNLRWEQTGTTNLGTDIIMFNGRLSIGADIWWKHTSDAIIDTKVSTVNGVTSYLMNRGALDNHGGSFSISGTPLQTRDWRLYLSVIASWTSNNIKSATTAEYALSDYLNGTALVNGQSVGTFYSYKFLGVSPVNGVPMFDDYEDRQYMIEGKTLAEVVPMVMTVSGNRSPKMTGSFSTMLTWKNLSLSAFFNYRVGSKVRLFKLFQPINSGVSAEKNVREEFLNRWQRPGDEKYTNIPTLLSPSSDDYYNYQSHWSKTGSVTGKIVTFAESVWDMYDYSDLRVVSGDYMKLSNLTLRYNFPSSILKGSFVKTLTLNFNMTNVFTIASSKLRGQDPTQASSTGVGMSLRPSYTFGLDVSF